MENSEDVEEYNNTFYLFLSEKKMLKRNNRRERERKE